MSIIAKKVTNLSKNEQNKLNYFKFKIIFTLTIAYFIFLV